MSLAPSKSSSAFRTIGEVATELSIPPHVLRFWETKFNQIRPHKRRGGHRYYRPQDVAVLKEIKHLLYDKGLTIKGAQKFLSDRKKMEDMTNQAALFGDKAAAPSGSNVSSATIRDIYNGLVEVKELLSQSA